MIPNSFPGKYIAFEGMDGCGKSTQCAKSANFLAAGKERVTKVKEPNREVLGGKLIYGLLFERGPVGFSSMSQLQRQSHYFFNRMQHYTQVVIPALKAGVNVLSDRSFASIALDMQKDGDLEALLTAEEYYFEVEEIPLIRPDLAIIYDVEPEVAIRRLGEKDERRRDFFEQPDKLLRTRAAYREFAAKFGDFCRVVDASEDADTVFAKHTRELLREYFDLQEWR
ncbi:MAG: dTMP kinase [Candidatus Paceibacterota bacterium]